MTPMTENEQAANNIKWQLVTTFEDLNSLALPWLKLVQQSSMASPFSSPQWLLTWYHTYWQSNWQLSTLTGYVDNNLIAILPCYIQHSLQWPYIKVLYPLGQGEPEEAEVSSEYCDAIITKKYEAIALPELQKKLVEFDVDKIYWSAALQSSHIKGLLENAFKYTAVTTHSRYCVERTKWTLQNLSKNTRARYKRSNNQLKKINATYHWVKPEAYEIYIAKLIEYHQNLWESRGNKGAFAHADFNRFHDEFRAKSSVKISAISVDNNPIAINYYFSDETTLYFYQCGWDSENYANFSLGLSLHLWSIENCSYQYYDFMMGELKNSYKEKFDAHRELMANLEIKVNPKKVFLHKLVHKVFSLTA
tara:strand:+ start:3178 stop:4266 length:1089 start_codon:yes stop_codon:yes gene_type:complete